MFRSSVFVSMVFAAFLFAGCNKTTATSGCALNESTLVASTAEIQVIQNYLTANSLVATQAPSGFFYNISVAGSGATPGICNSVTVQYSGYLFSGFKFAESLGGSTYPLSQLIVGWQKGMELIQNGGSITLYIPPSLGYGANATATIPANSFLIFTVHLANVL